MLVVVAVNLHPIPYSVLAMQLAVHCADLGNPAKPVAASMNWAARITSEFLLQARALTYTLYPMTGRFATCRWPRPSC